MCVGCMYGISLCFVARIYVYYHGIHLFSTDNEPLTEFLMIVDYKMTATDRDLVMELSLEQSVIL